MHAEGSRAAPRPAAAGGRSERRWRVLVVEDSAVVRAFLVEVLEQAGFECAQADRAEVIPERVESFLPDVMLLDVGLPAESGLVALRRLRERSGLPVIIVSAAGAEAERVAGLNAGADDYLVKPVSTAELVARVQSVIRRSNGGLLVHTVEHGSLRIDMADRRVFVDGDPVELTRKEFELLAMLAGTPGRTFTREELLERVWSSKDTWQDPSTVTEHVRRVRVKVGPDSDAGRAIVTVRGVGYRFEV